MKAILGLPDEWVDISGDGIYALQHKECPALFTYEDGVGYSDALVMVEHDGNHINGSFWENIVHFIMDDESKKIGSSLDIKGFPFIPKTFYINVFKKEINGKTEYFMKNSKQLEEALTYYKKREIL